MSGPATSPLRVLVADDDDAFRRALTAALDGVGRVEVVGAARDGREAIELFSKLAPDVVLMDVVMPRCDGIAATREILATDPGARIIALTSADDYRALALCLAAGATGCLKKDGGTLALAPLMISLHGARAPAKRTDPPPNTSDRRRSRMRASVPAIVLALGVALAACGGSDSYGSKENAAIGPPPPSRDVAARLGEYRIKLDHVVAPSGEVTFTIHNAGALEHEFVVLRTQHGGDALPVEGNEANEDAAIKVDEAEDIGAGTTVKLTVKLKPGRYILICNLPGHYSDGMRATLRVD